jgi:uncharacterized protein (DUF2062 family)
MDLLLFVLCSISLTNIIVREYIFQWMRNIIKKIFPYSLLNKMIHCETCTGFWVGVALSLIFPFFGLHWFIAGLISSISNKILAILLFKF